MAMTSLYPYKKRSCCAAGQLAALLQIICSLGLSGHPAWRQVIPSSAGYLLQYLGTKRTGN